MKNGKTVAHPAMEESNASRLNYITQILVQLRAQASCVDDTLTYFIDMATVHSADLGNGVVPCRCAKDNNQLAVDECLSPASIAS
ncbi:hypothetical protein [Shinella granuli]|uniref:hypothetical protein n=1 Tax=Shinella granuli TaxID=323621 RepID=UPI001056DF26|nr:hypothetical protein [Shinella granuli]